MLLAGAGQPGRLLSAARRKERRVLPGRSRRACHRHPCLRGSHERARHDTCHRRRTRVGDRPAACGARFRRAPSSPLPPRRCLRRSTPPAASCSATSRRVSRTWRSSGPHCTWRLASAGGANGRGRRPRSRRAWTTRRGRARLRGSATHSRRYGRRPGTGWRFLSQCSGSAQAHLRSARYGSSERCTAAAQTPARTEALTCA